MKKQSVTRGRACLLFAAVVLGACGGEPAERQPSGGSASGAGGSAASAGASGDAAGSGSGGAVEAGAGGQGSGEGGASAESCEDGVRVGSVAGKVLDVSGAPPTVEVVSVCGNACIKGTLSDDGSFVVKPGGFCYTPTALYPVPVFLYHGGPEYADVTVDFVPEGANGVHDIAFERPIYTLSMEGLPKTTYEPEAAQTFSDGKGFALSVTPGAIDMPLTQEWIAAIAVDLAHFPLPSGNGAEDLTALYYVSPDNTPVDPPGHVRFPNVATLPAGSPVELVAIGNAGTEGVIKAGTLGVVGKGRVSGDGLTVESDPALDTGLITLGWIGYRPAQP